ncbi:hypothetical protein ACTXT7_001360 [Hymenolepis weldensis]
MPAPTLPLIAFVPYLSLIRLNPHCGQNSSWSSALELKKSINREIIQKEAAFEHSLTEERKAKLLNYTPIRAWGGIEIEALV